MTDYKSRRTRLERQIGRLERLLVARRAISNRYAWSRLALFVGGILVALAGFYFVSGWLGWPLLVGTFIIFNVVARYHRRLDHSIARLNGWLGLKRLQLARLNLDWSALPDPQVPTLPDHPFEIDLDISGPRSVHRLLDTATSREASLRLRDWLTQTHPDLVATTRRQELVKELVPLALFREKLWLQATLNSSDLKTGVRWEGQRLLDWLRRHTTSLNLTPTLVALSVLAALNIGLFVLNRFGMVPPLWIATFVVYVIVYNVKGRDTDDLFYEAYNLRDGLARLRPVFGYLETYRYGANRRLKELLAPLLNKAARPSRQLRGLEWVVIGITIQRNYPLWLVLNALVPWRFYFCREILKRKADLEKQLPGWLEVWFELESLNSLANFGWLNKGYTFPSLALAEDKLTIFRADQLGHPMIPAEEKVRNSFSMEKMGEMTIITGSNMAGKSSFLKAVGVNLCLAYAGGPVDAEHLSAGLFRLFGCIKVSDSLTDGFSYFYAEVRRLKALLDAVRDPDPRPVFFLIDEIFRGTNNRERLTGSRSYLQALAGSRCVGLVSTHDLELIHLAELNPLIHNYHFREEVEGDQLRFDYKLRQGPSPTTNALVIMRLAGLPVPPQVGQPGTPKEG
ncbi:MAG: hypothetical protein J0I20_08845 [Chloroflexi bacterium]|nr:hypothetical protein [Chloroflexota bacterium]OJV97035.1 MAG: hypothetical protein BGO39_18695 [Chloroflexi bacterium 54-19]